MSEETTSALAICHLSGGPQDGERHLFKTLPIVLVDEQHGGYYERAGGFTADGAHLFEYHAPQTVAATGSQ
jgi:hypothetical protein